MERNRPLVGLVKVAFIGLLARPLPSLGALLFVVLLWFAHVLFYPASVFLPVLVNFSLGALVMSLAAARGVQLGFSHRLTNAQHKATGKPETQSV